MEFSFSLLLTASLLLIVAIALAAISLRYVQRKALQPLIELSDLAEQVANEHNYTYRAKIHRADEVGRLTDHFNEMLKRIEIWQENLHLQLQQEHLAGKEYQQLANKDSLTQLPNRLFFKMIYIAEWLAVCKRVI